MKAHWIAMYAGTLNDWCNAHKQTHWRIDWRCMQAHWMIIAMYSMNAGTLNDYCNVQYECRHTEWLLGCTYAGTLHDWLRCMLGAWMISTLYEWMIDCDVYRRSIPFCTRPSVGPRPSQLSPQVSSATAPGRPSPHSPLQYSETQWTLTNITEGV